MRSISIKKAEKVLGQTRDDIKALGYRERAKTEKKVRND